MNVPAPVKRRVLVLVVDKVNLLDLAGPVQVFDAASFAGAEYDIEYVGETHSVVSAQELRLDGLGALPTTGRGDLVLVPGPRLTGGRQDAPLFSETVLAWLRDAAGSGASVAAVCTGAALLGDAGLLDGRRCTSHWGVLDLMRARYPNALVQDGVIFVHDGPISTSAGIAAGTDLALSIVEQQYGPLVAAVVARELVVYVRRDGLAEQLSPFLDHRAHLNPVVHEVQEVLTKDVSASPSLSDLASATHVSVRALTQAFVTTIGMTPLQYQRDLRMDLAATLLATTDQRIDDIALQCGFADSRHLRRLFAARWGQSPSRYRKHHRRSDR
jgi:transcriptional regulator GlxA family with amidase domain